MRGSDPYFSTQNRERRQKKKNVENKRKEKMEKEGDYSPDGYGIWSRSTTTTTTKKKLVATHIVYNQELSKTQKTKKEN